MASELFVGGTYRFEATFYENEADCPDSPMNITGATVTLRWHYRNALGVMVTVERVATVIDGPNGVARYTSLTTDLAVGGEWQESWLMELGDIVLPGQPEGFTVKAVW